MVGGKLSYPDGGWSLKRTAGRTYNIRTVTNGGGLCFSAVAEQYMSSTNQSIKQ